MSHALYRLGRYATRRPWRVIAAWLVAAIVIVVAAGAVGRELDDSIAVPGLDSHEATELLSRAGSAEAGLTAYVVATPLDEDATFFESADARADLQAIRAELVALPAVLGATDSSPASGNVADSITRTVSSSASRDARFVTTPIAA